MTVNTTSRWAWAYETTPGSAEITMGTDTTYFFGHYDEETDKWQPPTIENQIGQFHKYNKRTPELDYQKRKFPTFKTIFKPITAQSLLWILGSGASGTPCSIDALHSGQQRSLTIRHEENEGTNPALTQAVGCQCVGAYFRSQAGSDFIAELEWEFEDIEDQGDRPSLTTTPTEAGGLDSGKVYSGSPEVTYDYGGGNETVLERVPKAEFRITQATNTSLNGAGTSRDVYKGKYEPVDIILTAIFEENQVWNDFIDRNIADWEIKVYKPDNTNYIDCVFHSGYQASINKQGLPFEGWYQSSLHIQAEYVSIEHNFNNEGTNYDTHFKGQI